MKIREDKGSFALFAILLLSAVTLVGGLYYFASSASGPASTAARPEEMFDRLRDQAEKALSTPEAVTFSLARNTNAFSCLYSSIGDCLGRGTTFLLYESGDVSDQPLSQLGKDTGLTAEGFGCRGYPSAACPLRVEATWDPVCAPGGRCENTSSMNVRVKVSMDDGTKPALDWEKSGFFSPVIQLSQGVTCERGGGVWTTTECLTREQAAQRSIASNRAAPAMATIENPTPIERPSGPSVPENPDQYICPNQIVVQGQYYPVDFITAGRGQVKVPAVNGCPAEDIFVFSCNRKEPSQFENEGQWIQVEAVMAGSDCQSQVGSNGSTEYERR